MMTETTRGKVVSIDSRKRPMEDDALVDGLKARNTAAAAAFYDRFGDLVNRLVRRFLGPDPDHDDVVHSIFMHALSSIGKLSDPEKLEPWLVSISINIVRKELRSRKYRSLLVPFQKGPDGLAGRPSNEFELVANRFYTLLGRLDADDRVILILRVAEGYKLEEIAQMCGCSLATVKRRIDKAKLAMKKLAERDAILAPRIQGYDNE